MRDLNSNPISFRRGLMTFFISVGLLFSILSVNGSARNCTLGSGPVNEQCRQAVFPESNAFLLKRQTAVLHQDTPDGSVRPRVILASHGMRHDFGVREYDERVAPTVIRIVQSNRFFPVLVLLGILAIVLLGYRLFWYKPLVPVMVVARREIQGVVKGLGRVRFQESVTVSAELSGTIEKLHVAQGARITKGQILAELTQSTLRKGDQTAPENLLPLVAPTDGVITTCVLAGGDEIYPGTPIFQIVEAEQIRIRMRTSEIRGGQVRAGQAAVIKLGPDREFAGEVMEVRKDPNPDSPQYEVLVKFQNAPDPAVIGEEAAITIATGRQTAPAVPMVAVIWRNNQYGVWVVDEGLVNFRPLSLGVQNGEWAAALEGVKEGELVIVVPETVKPGKGVRAEVVTAAFMEE